MKQKARTSQVANTVTDGLHDVSNGLFRIPQLVIVDDLRTGYPHDLEVMLEQQIH